MIAYKNIGFLNPLDTARHFLSVHVRLEMCPELEFRLNRRDNDSINLSASSNIPTDVIEDENPTPQDDIPTLEDNIPTPQDEMPTPPDEMPTPQNSPVLAKNELVKSQFKNSNFLKYRQQGETYSHEFKRPPLPPPKRRASVSFPVLLSERKLKKPVVIFSKQRTLFSSSVLII